MTAHFFGGLQTKIILDKNHNARDPASTYEYEKQFINETIILQAFKKVLPEKRESIGDWVLPFADVVSFCFSDPGGKVTFSGSY